MSKKNSPIGVIDSGVGGLTVLRELHRIMPTEDYIYFGDSLNCPYGNRDKESLLRLINNMLAYLKKNDVKAVAVACNTTSSFIEDYKHLFDYYILGIVPPVAHYVAGENLERVGLIATEFTVKTAFYNKLIKELNPSTEVVGQGSRNLAELVDRGDFNKAELSAEITTCIDAMLLKSPNLNDIILGCTHYPIVDYVFRECYPDVNFINPAFEQAAFLKKYLSENNLLSDKENGKVLIHTSGDIAPYKTVCNMLSMEEPDEYRTVSIV